MFIFILLYLVAYYWSDFFDVHILVGIPRPLTQKLASHGTHFHVLNQGTSVASFLVLVLGGGGKTPKCTDRKNLTYMRERLWNI